MRSRFLLLPAAILGLAALAAAAPSHQRHQQQQQPQRPRHQPAKDAREPRAVAAPIRSDEFSLAMSVNGTYLALVAVANDTSGDLILQAEVTGTSPGTPSEAVSFSLISNPTPSFSFVPLFPLLRLSPAFVRRKNARGADDVSTAVQPT